MRRSKMILLSAILLVSTAVVSAAEDASYDGSVSLEGRVTDQTGQSAFLNQYEDMDDAVFGNFWANYYKGKAYLELEGRNCSLTDQSYGLKVGRYETFKFSFSYDEVPHKISLGARTFYHGIGSNTLTYSAVDRQKDTDTELIPNVSTDPATWSVFNYEEQRRTFGVGLELSLNSPYFFRVKFTEDKQEGTRPAGVVTGVFPDVAEYMLSAMGNVVELPKPVDYKTQNTVLEAGYRSERVVFKLSGMLSDFKNENKELSWRNPYVTTEELHEIISLPPDNDYYKVAGQVSVQLPYRSALAVRGGYSKGTSESLIDPTIPVSTDGFPPYFLPFLPLESPIYGTRELDLSTNRFKGVTSRANASVAFSSRPTKSLDIRAYYKYFERDSDSSVITFSTTDPEDPTNTGTVQNHPYGFEKHNAGIDLGYWLPMATKAMLGFDWSDIGRDELPIAESTTDREVWFELLNRHFEACTLRLKYAHLDRSSDFKLGDIGESLIDPISIKRFVRYYDSTDKNRDAVRFDLNFHVAETAEAGVWYQYQRDDFKETVLGRTEADNHEVYLDAAWEPRESIRFSGFIGYERGKSKADKRYLDDFDTPLITDPVSGTQLIEDLLIQLGLGRPTTTYNWSYEATSNYWDFALAGEAPLIKDKLKFIASWRHQIHDGHVDFSSEGVLEPVDNIGNSNDYTLNEVIAKLIITPKRHCSVALGYTYQKFEYEDVQIDGYEYVSTDTRWNRYFFSGAGADNEEENHIFYAGVSYQY